MIAICPAGPPKLMNPSFSQNPNASRKETGVAAEVDAVLTGAAVGVAWDMVEAAPYVKNVVRASLGRAKRVLRKRGGCSSPRRRRLAAALPTRQRERARVSSAKASVKRQQIDDPRDIGARLESHELRECALSAACIDAAVRGA